jgi:radical SAM enzyme (TIGR01210 family)
MPDRREIERLRPAKNFVSATIPYHFLHEQEPDAAGKLQEVNTIFLTGKECAFRCVMCDLWKNTLDEATPRGAIAAQINYALERLPQAKIIKLYNSSNFFDPQAVPPADYDAIIESVKGYERVIVENHPDLCNKNCITFNNKLNAKLEIAMGLESIHPGVLPKLNKRLTTENFAHAVQFLRNNNMDARAFILLNPPFLTDQKENIEWTLKAVQFAFDCGVGCCSIIPARAGNGIMEALKNKGEYVPPVLSALEEVFETALGLQGGRVLADTWDIGFISECPHCFEARKQRLETMNLTQTIHEKIYCNYHS